MAVNSKANNLYISDTIAEMTDPSIPDSSFICCLEDSNIYFMVDGVPTSISKSGSTTSTVLANFGSTWKRSGKITITDALITAASKINCSIGKMIFSEGRNWSEDETPSIQMQAVAGIGNFDVWWQCTNQELVGGNIQINYNYQ